MTEAIEPTPDLVTRILREHLNLPELVCASCERSAIGNGQEIWLLSTRTPDAATDYVLRRTSKGGPLEWTDRLGEAAVMSAVARSGLPVPLVHVARDENPELGLPYLIMDRAPGASGAMVPKNLRAHVAEQVARDLPRVHCTDPVAAFGAQPPLTRGQAVRVQLEQWRARYMSDRPFPVPMLRALLDDLVATAPADDTPASVVWGDPGYHNVLVNEQGHVTALLDWELAHLGHPLEDLGVLVWMEAGRVAQTDVVAAYERSNGERVDPDTLRYFIALACVTRSIMVLAGEKTCLDGKSSEPSTLALGAHLLIDSLERAARLLNWPAPGIPSGAELARADHQDTSPPCSHPDLPGEILPTIAESDAVLARYLLGRVLPHVSDARLARGIKTAAALLRTTANRERLRVEAARRRRAHFAELSRALGPGADPACGDVEQLLDRCREGGDLHGRQDVIRAYLCTDLREQRTLIAPLDELYGTRSGQNSAMRTAP